MRIPYMYILEDLFIELYDMDELDTSTAMDFLFPLQNMFIDPDKTAGFAASDGKKFHEIVCLTFHPDTHRDNWENPVWINPNGPWTWENMEGSQDLFDTIWFDEMGIPYCSNAAEDRRGIIP